jgi:hypothetical protein
MKLKVTISQTVSGATSTVPRIEIDQGEPLSVPLQNADGSAWDTTGATIKVFAAYSRTEVSPNPCTITGGAVQMTALASSALTPGPYVIQVWKAAGALATDGSADIALSVH